MTRRYETIFITPADIPDEELQALIDRCATIITGRKGLLVKVEKWGKRKLAYEIKKQLRGFYVLLDFAGQTDIVNELERNFKIDDKVLKYMTVKKDEIVDLQALEGELNAAAARKPNHWKALPRPHLRKETPPEMIPRQQQRQLHQENKWRRGNDTCKKPKAATAAKEVFSPA